MPEKETKTVTKKYTPEEVREIMSDSTIGGDLNENLRLLSQEIFPAYFHGTEQEKKAARERFDKVGVEAMIAMETKTHVALMEAFPEKYRGLAREFTRQLVKDYNCKNAGEIALAETAVNAYIRTIDNSRRLNNELECKNITPERNKYIAMLSKQVDRANRQFISSLLTLRQFKAPAVEMNIKATTAFVSQNQQVNVNKDSHEIVESK